MSLSIPTPRTNPGEITRVLSNTNNPESLRTVMQLAYGELHRIAVGHSRKPRGHTWQPTALLNEACIRLIESGTLFRNHRHFFGSASNAMRQILIDSARRRHALKRGGNWRRVDFSEAELIGFERPSDVLDFDTALTRLEAVKPGLSEIAKLRVFGGLTTTQAATVLRIGESTARRKWATAREWLALILVSPTGGRHCSGE
jgi:RNA polymerase sigma factor (TIGR02999 family)